MADPRVSVVIPTFNHARYVVAAVDSALAQTRPPLEVIVVDDGSTDDTRDRLASYAGRIRYIYQPNAGLSAARNAGIRAAGGGWVAFLDADDLFHPRKLELQAAAVVRHPDLALLGAQSFSDEPVRWPDVPDDPPVVRLRLPEVVIRTPFAPSSVLARRDVFDAAGYFEPGLRSVEDRDMWVRLAARGPVARLDAPLCWYRQTPGSMSRNPDRMEAFDRLVIDRSFALPELRGRQWLRRRAMAHMLLASSYTYLQAGRPAAAAARAVRALAWYPAPLPAGETHVRFVRPRLLARAVARLFAPARA